MYLDIAFIVILIVSTLCGFLFGFFKTLKSFLGWFVCSAFALMCAQALADAFLSSAMAAKIVSSGGIYDSVYGVLPDEIKSISMETIRQSIAAGENEVQIALKIAGEAGGIAKLFTTVIQSAVSTPLYLNSTLQNVAQVLAVELTYHIYVVIVAIVFFILLRIIIMGVAIMGEAKSRKYKRDRAEKKKGRILKNLLTDRLFGLGVGLIRGVAYGCILLIVMSYCAGLGDNIQKQVDESKISAAITAPLTETLSERLSNDLQENERYMGLVAALEERLSAEAE
ncbi:MAG: hypothetical protein IKC48_03445 [Clostridia bacterium]|nr:hypothetical protein [Clostridia bacterium]